jgi:CO/xanthine dehydrogenase FAD-binding subunit
VKPAAFEYHDPRQLSEALALLQMHPEEAKVLAGGQSLVPLMNFRLARPGVVVDINRVQELRHISEAPSGIAIGALARHADIDRSPLIADLMPVLREAARLVGHPQIRNRGTVGGSVAHADPAAELPCALLALEARYHLASVAGSRVVSGDDLFVDVFTTAIRPDELLVEIEVPTLPPRTGHAFVEFARRHGDFALGGACALLTLDGDGRCARARLALLAAGPRPLRARAAEAVLEGTHLDAAALERAAGAAVADVSPSGDIHGSSWYRVRLLETLARRSLDLAAGRARELWQ